MKMASMAAQIHDEVDLVEELGRRGGVEPRIEGQVDLAPHCGP
jgi:hypothetical protein